MIIMTFGVNTLDWTNIGRKLQTRLAETFRNETVGDACTACTAESSVLTPFAYYDGATGTVLTTYSAYLDNSMADAFTPAEVVTTKLNEEGIEEVIDVTPLPLLYSGFDADGNEIITTDSSVEGVDVDPDSGRSISILTNSPLSEEYEDNLLEIYEAAVNTDTVWAPDHMLTLDSATTGNSYQEVESVANSDTTAWVRLRARNGLESIYFSIPTASMAGQEVSTSNRNTLSITLPETFTFDDNTFFYPHGIVVEIDTPATAAASTVEATSLASTKLSSTYETSLTDLNTDYESVLSGTVIGGGSGGGSGGTNGSTDCQENATYNTTDAKCECNDDGTWNGAYKLNASNECVPGVGMIISSKLTDGKSAIVENKWVVAGGAFVLLGGIGWMSGLFRGSKKTLGQQLDKAVGSGKELEG